MRRSAFYFGSSTDILPTPCVIISELCVCVRRYLSVGGHVIAARMRLDLTRGLRRRWSNVVRERTHVQPVAHREFNAQPRLSLVYSYQAGGLAGTSVDLLFYPIDSIKTRLQSDLGFYKAGGFRGIYNGVASVIVGSAPGGIPFLSLSVCASCPNFPHLDPSCCLLLYL